tara:strand:- start:619 stop:1032 length:414 start_codon:yes stop_codon:yes gene_type:complete
MNDLNATETMSQDDADKAVFEAAKAEAPHPHEGNIGVGEYTTNGELSKVADSIIEEVIYKTDNERQSAIYALDEYIRELKEGAIDNIKSDIDYFLSDRYNISFEDADIILAGVGDFSSLEDAITSKVDSDFDNISIC